MQLVNISHRLQQSKPRQVMVHLRVRHARLLLRQVSVNQIRTQVGRIREEDLIVYEHLQELRFGRV